MKITIIYDNETTTEELAADWGFACLVEAHGKKILFDTGAKGEILMANMAELRIDHGSIDEVFISHDHWDHIDGLADFLKARPCKVYLPGSCEKQYEGCQCERIAEPIQLHENVYSTGELESIEQSMVVRLGEKVVVIAGCSHPGVRTILEAAAQFGKPTALIGGLHGFDEFDVLEPLELVCPTHCTQHIAEIKERYPEKCGEGGAGTVIQIEG